MFHLFDNVYVETEHRARVQDHQINISESTGFEKIEHPFIVQGEQLGFAQSLDEFGPTGFYSLLLKAAEKGQKVWLYVDAATYVRLYSILLKALFPKIDYQTYKMFFICIKATYDTSTVTFFDTVQDHSLAVNINRELVESLYEQEEPLVEGVRKLLQTDPNKVSMEWRIVKLLGTDQVGTLPETVRNIMRRTAISNSHDAMDDWGRVICDQTRWDVSGATEDSLLDSPSTFMACKNFGCLSESLLRLPKAMSLDKSDDDCIDLLTNIIKVLESTGDIPSMNRSKNLKALFEEDKDMTDPKNLIGRLKRLFDDGPATFRLPSSDAAKYDENLIRHVLRMSEEQIANLLEDATW